MTGGGGAVVAVDVGSTSARAGVVDRGGRLLASASVAFEVNRPAPHHAEHDSEQIWAAACAAVRAAVATSGVAPEDVAALAFDATCSLVMLDDADTPATVSTTGEPRWNVIMWADHRAVAEAEEITATGHRVLDYVGGVMSPEMELPKLLWLKRNLPAAWARYGRALDLADFLTWSATGADAVSACTVTCKWTYLNHEEPGWQADLLSGLGLTALPQKLRLPPVASPIGAYAGGLTAAAAAGMGLVRGTAVGIGLIDAHAGGLGLLAGANEPELDVRIALIAGTSNCHMAMSRRPRPVPGVWGPYYGAMLPEFWLNEGGQSATGALLDHVLASHAEGRALGPSGHARIQEHIGAVLAKSPLDATRGLLVVPDFNGNRSPLADPHLRGMIHGLDLDASLDGLARLYLGAAAGIGYGTRHIIDALDAGGYAIREIHLTGGHAKSALLSQMYADTTGRDVLLPREADAVLLGTAIVAAVAAGWHADIPTAGRSMVHAGRRVKPEAATRALHDRRYAAFRRMVALGQEIAATA